MVELLASVPGFRGLPDSALEIVEGGSEHLMLSTGDVLFLQGEFDDAMYIVVSGSLEMVAMLGNGQRQLLARFGPSDWIGESVVLFHRPRKATVYASAPAEVMKLSLPRLATLFDKHPGVYNELVRVAARRLLSFHIASSPLMAGVDIETLRMLDGEANWIRLAGMETLFKQGDTPDYLYVVVCGRLEVVAVGGDGREEIVGYVGRGDLVGEMGLLTDEPRSRTVRATRDTQLVRLSKGQFELLLSQNPQCMRYIAKRLATIISHNATGKIPKARLSTIAIVTAQSDGVASAFIERMIEAISGIAGPSLHLSSRRIDYELGPGSSSVTDEAGHTRLINWLAEYEDQFSYLLLECDPRLSPWTALCIRSADLVLIVSSAKDDPSVRELESAIFERTVTNRAARKELVLLHSDGAKVPSGTAAWLSKRQVDAHHHIRIGHATDYQRLARFITDKAVGLVLSGGGARGHGHVGAIRALEHCGVPIDFVGGTSIGAAVAALWAINADVAALIRIGKDFSDTFRKHFLRDLTFPAVALNSARRFTRSLEDLFGGVRIEDLWIPYFCTSTDLSKADVVVHEEGLVSSSVRASSAIPGIWPPVVCNGHILVDGGVLSNLPVDVMRKRCRGSVIAVDVGSVMDLTVRPNPAASLSGWRLRWKQLNPFGNKTELPHIFNILSRAAQLGSIRAGDVSKGQADLYLQPPTSEIDLFDWKSAYKLVDVAYQHCIDEVEQWKLREAYGSYGST